MHRPDDPQVNLQQASVRVSELRDQIRKHDYLYYVVAEPVVSDLQYDQLLKELADW